MVLADFHFLRPWWLAALPLLALLAAAWWRRGAAGGAWARVVDPRLAPHVLEGGGRRRRGGTLLALCAGALAVLALAGPAWERQVQPLERSGDALVVALDLSRSMDASDVSPSRLERARLKLIDLLERRRGGQTALIVYSANAFTVTPLTDDVDTIEALVSSLSTDIMPSRGSYPAAALEKAASLLEQADAPSGRVLLITDGGAVESGRRAARELAARGYSVSVLGVGTREGGPIPKQGGGFVKNREGRMVVPRLEERGLMQIAAAGGGRYHRLTAGDEDLRAVAPRPGAPGDAAVAETADGARELTVERWRDAGPWLALALLPLAALGFRRGAIVCFLLAVLPASPPAQAFSWDDLWRTPDQQAAAALERGEPGRAAELFEDPAWRAVARYREGRYAASAEDFAGLEGADAAYNRGNALAYAGDVGGAIDAYEEALALDPEHADARHNLDLLRRLRQQADDSQSESAESGRQAGEQSASSENRGDEGQAASEEDRNGEGEQSAQRNAGNQRHEGASADPERDEGGEREAAGREEDERRSVEATREAMRQALREAERDAGDSADGEPGDTLAAVELTPEERERLEQQQALEQWLRRIPNDPGGLLRRKFREQYRRSGRDQDGNALWPDDQTEPW